MKSRWVILALVGFAGLALFLLLPAINFEGKLRRTEQELKLSRISLALHNYHDIYNSFPPAIVYNDYGEKLYSWRVLLLPFFVTGEDETPQRNNDWVRSIDLWDYFELRRSSNKAQRIDDQIRKFMAEFDLTQAWDSPANRHLSAMNFELYRRTNSKKGATTDYFAVTGPDTAWPLDRATKFGDFLDGSSNSIMVVEGGDVVDVCWAEPRDLEFEKMSFKINGPERPGIFGRTASGAYIAWADGSTEMLSTKTDPETVKSLLLINDTYQFRRVNSDTPIQTPNETTTPSILKDR